MSRPLAPAALHAAGAGRPLELAAQGFFWTGGELVTLPGGEVAMRGQQYCEYWIPRDLRHTTPIVMIHGGGGQGTDFLGTPDGREGWAKWFVRAGWPVYVVDRPQHGRSPFHPAVQGAMAPPGPAQVLERLFTRPGAFADNYPQASRHSQWPGSGAMDDPAFLAFLAGTGPTLADKAAAERDAQHAGAQLLDAIGPAILLTHSAGGPPGWLIADARPDLVRAIVAVEPLGPPFAALSGPLPYGITHAPLCFDPPLAPGEALASADMPSPGPGLVAYRVQAEPARRLAHLAAIPMLVLTAEASWMAADNHAIVHFLRQAGCAPDHWRLEEHGVSGNGHAMQLEANSDAVAGVIARWLDDKGLAQG